MLSHFAKNTAVSACRSQARRQMGLLAPLLGGNVNQSGLHEEFGGTPALIPMKLSAPTVESATTDYGVRVTSEDTKSPLATITLNIGVGSRDADSGTSGSALLLKHLTLASTDNRSKLRIQRELDEMGASITSTMGRENTTIHAAVQAHHFRKLIDILGNTLTSKQPSRGELVNVETHVQHEVTHASSACVLCDAIHGAAYYDSIGLGLPIYDASCASIEAAHTLYHRAHVGPNISVAITGVDHDQALKGVEERFIVPTRPLTREPSQYVGGELRVARDGASQIAIAFDAGSSNPAAATVLAAVLGSASQRSRHSIGGVTTGRASSILEGGEYLTAVSGFAHTHSDGGIVGISATTKFADAKSFSALASALQTGGITDAEVARAKAVLVGAAAADASSQSGRGAAYIAANIAGQPSAADIKAVTTADVTATLASALKTAPSFATVGDFSYTPRYNALSAMF